MTATESIALRVNGTERTAPSSSTVVGLLEHLGRDPAMPGVAVAVNEAVVPRSQWGERTLDEGDRIEIITASQGG